MTFTEEIRNFEGQPLTRQILYSLLTNYKRPGDKLTDLVKDKVLTHVKAKVYVPGPELSMKGPEPFLLANHLAGPSYISFEAALSYWGLIPEHTVEVTSAILGRAKIYKTAVGRFRYTALPAPYFSFGQVSVDVAAKQAALLAKPEKAICDTIIATAGVQFRSPGQAKIWLLDDMRMERERLREMKIEMMRSWLPDAPKKQSLEFMVQTLEEL